MVTLSHKHITRSEESRRYDYSTRDMSFSLGSESMSIQSTHSPAGFRTRRDAEIFNSKSSTPERSLQPTEGPGRQGGHVQNQLPWRFVRVQTNLKDMTTFPCLRIDSCLVSVLAGGGAGACCGRSGLGSSEGRDAAQHSVRRPLGP